MTRCSAESWSDGTWILIWVVDRHQAAASDIAFDTPRLSGLVRRFDSYCARRRVTADAQDDAATLTELLLDPWPARYVITAGASSYRPDTDLPAAIPCPFVRRQLRWCDPGGLSPSVRLRPAVRYRPFLRLAIDRGALVVGYRPTRWMRTAGSSRPEPSSTHR